MQWNILLYYDDFETAASVYQSLESLQYPVVMHNIKTTAAVITDAIDIVLFVIKEFSVQNIKSIISIKQQIQTIIPLLVATESWHHELETVKDVIDDILCLPIDNNMLRQKFYCYQSMKQRRQQLALQQKQLQHYQNLLETEKKIAEKIFTTINRSDTFNLPKVNYLLTAKSTFTGDVLLLAENHQGDLYGLLGDFTGHGLPAAIGSIPMAQAFYTMIEKGFTAKDILLEINIKLKALLPSSVFCAAVMMVLDRKKCQLHYWNAGLPNGYIISPGTGIKAQLLSSELPLGIMDNNKLTIHMTTIAVEPGDKIVVFSDGVTEAANGSGELFGEDKIKNILGGFTDGSMLETLVASLKTYTQHTELSDDTTILELTV